MKVDLQDCLLLVGVAFLVGGIGAWSKPAAAVVLGLLCLGAVWMIERGKPRGKSAGKGSE